VSAPRILFGVGATKAGTSWLYEWLAGHDDVHFRGVKEVHYFNSFERERVENRRAELAQSRARMLKRGAPQERIDDFAACERLFEAPENPVAYAEYLMEGRGAASVVGDVTPAYGLLSVDRLKSMAALGNTRFLYILRDPVARLWSHVRMIARRREPDGSVTAERAGRILKRTLRGDEGHIAERSDYRRTFRRLEAAVPGPKRLVVFFEELISGQVTDEVCAFLGIAPRAPLARVVHGGRALDMTPMQAADARAYLAEQYEFVENAMGRVPDQWRQTHEGIR
jgi:hypothetical protein